MRDSGSGDKKIDQALLLLLFSTETEYWATNIYLSSYI